MRMVAMICGIHIWWGLSLIFGVPLPRPFGALEPFFAITPSSQLVGLLLASVGFLPLTATLWRESKLWCISCLMIPQQIVLCWGLIVSIIDISLAFDGRSWYALGYTSMLFFFHSLELRDEFVYEIVKRKTEREKRKAANGLRD